ncbi:hypothetical protein RhiirB3_439254 [Rhizophagus irregularis]|nr:hypothetical protein RhiirB3_439254 [Rhizophagus irregularis]
MGIRVVVAIDFGTTFPSFANANLASPEIITSDILPQQIGQSCRNKDSSSKSVKLFKLHLKNISQSEKPPLPHQLSYEKAICGLFYAN